MTKRTRATRQQAARRRTPPRPGTPGGASTGAPTGGIGRTAPPPDTAATLDGDTAAEETAAPAAPAAAASPAGPTARRVGRVNPASAASRARVQSKQQPSFAPLDPEDPAIPFDRVPYVPGDLRRVGIMAGLAVLLILIAAVIVTHTVG